MTTLTNPEPSRYRTTNGETIHANRGAAEHTYGADAALEEAKSALHDAAQAYLKAHGHGAAHAARAAARAADILAQLEAEPAWGAVASSAAQAYGAILSDEEHDRLNGLADCIHAAEACSACKAYRFLLDAKHGD